MPILWVIGTYFSSLLMSRARRCEHCGECFEPQCYLSVYWFGLALVLAAIFVPAWPLAALWFVLQAMYWILAPLKGSKRP